MKKAKTFHRILALLLVLVMTASLAACAVKDDNTKKEDNKQNSQDNNSGKNDADDQSSDDNSEDNNTPADTKTDSGVLAGKTEVTAEDILARDFSDNVKISFAGVQVTDGLDYNHGNDYYSW